MRIDASTSNFQPGIMLAEIKGCEVKNSRKDNSPYFQVSWHDCGAFGAGEFICKDIIMLAGGGKGIGLSKLRVLGFKEVMGDDGKPYIDASAEELLGRRAWIRLGWENYTGQDGEPRRSLKVKTEVSPVFSSGYWNEKMPPDGVDDSHGIADVGNQDVSDGDAPF